MVRQPGKELIPVLVDACEKVGEVWGALVVDPHGSHVLRTVLKLLLGEAPQIQPVGVNRKHGSRQPGGPPTKRVTLTALRKTTDAFIRDFENTTVDDLR